MLASIKAMPLRALACAYRAKLKPEAYRISGARIYVCDTPLASALRAIALKTN